MDILHIKKVLAPVDTGICYAEYRKSKAEMQDWAVAQRIVQTILGEEGTGKRKKQEQLRQQQEAREQKEDR